MCTFLQVLFNAVFCVFLLNMLWMRERPFGPLVLTGHRSVELPVCSSGPE